MRLEVNKIPHTKELTLKEVVILDKEKYPSIFPLNDVESVDVIAVAHKYEDFVNLDLKIKAKVTLICSYSLKPFNTVLHASDNLNFAFYEDDAEDDILLLKGNILNLDEYIYDLVISAIPLKPIAPNAKKPESGDGYRVISSDEFELEQKENGNSKFDKLKDLDID